MENPLEIIGKNVRNSRKQAGLSQQILAEKAGISYKYLGEIERGCGNLSVEILLKISTALGIAAGSLIDPAQADIPQEQQRGCALLAQMSPEQVALAVAVLETLSRHSPLGRNLSDTTA